MKISQETTNFRKHALWTGICLSIAIFTLVIAAIFNVCEMREKVKDIQTFLGGLSVLAASLYSFYASSAAAAETYRKNLQDDESLIRNVRSNMILIAETLRQQSHARLIDLNRQTNGYKVGNIHFKYFDGLIIIIPEQATEIWKNIGQVSQDIQLQFLNLINFADMAEKDRINRMAMHKYLQDEHVDMNDKILKASEKGIVDDEIFKRLNDLNIEINRIEWNRIAVILANINRISINFLREMEESRNWRPDLPPYPPDFEPHEYTKPAKNN